MKTLYLRNVPEDVVRRLQQLAVRDGTSVGAVAVRELPTSLVALTIPHCSASSPTWVSTYSRLSRVSSGSAKPVIVLDASAALSGLLNAGPARESLASAQLHAPHLVDSEVAHGLRRQVALGRIATDDGWATLDAWHRLGLTRYATPGLLERIWEPRDTLSAHDTGYVALAESLACSLVTADARTSRAPGIRCPITFVPR